MDSKILKLSKKEILDALYVLCTNNKDTMYGSIHYEDIFYQLDDYIEELEKENKFWKEYKEKLDKLDTKDFIFKHELENYIPKSVIREKIEEYKKYGLKRNVGSFIDMSTYKAITYEEALDELKEELLGEEK